MIKFLFLSLISFSLVFNSTAQIQKKYKNHGDKLMVKGDYFGALKNYDIAMSYDSNDVGLLFAYAEGLRLTNYYKKALHYYNSVQRLDRRRDYTLAIYYSADMYKYLGEYTKSMKDFNRFVKKFKGDKSKYEYQRALYEITNNLDFSHLLKDTTDLYLSNDHPINTGNSEFGGFFADESHLLYTSLKSDSLKRRLVLDSSHYYARIYLSQKEDNKWQPKGLHPAFVYEEEINIANPTYSPKAEYVYYSECPGRQCEIWRAVNREGEWSDFELLPPKINLEGYTNSQPFLARIDGYDILFFVSDRPGGYGKLDIWYSIAYSNGLYEDPVNLGDSINSPGNDICPFYFDKEEALYFSSDWYIGLGGYDIFRSQKTGDKFFSPQNLGYPLNSSYNDLYFKQKGNEAVITSNRKGSLTDKFENCCNDLFFMDYNPKTIRTEIELSDFEKIEKLLPLKLYFNNDEPNPGTRDTITSSLYSATFIQYVAKSDIFKKEYARGLKNEQKEQAEEEMNYFFDAEVKLGYEDLKRVMILLHSILESGQKIELTIKGFASPLSKAEYNQKLTLRRISSVINELIHYNRGAFLPYLANNQLIIKKFPFGEDKISGLVSDDRNDKRNAIYSKKASFERRVEIIGVRLIK